MTKLSEVQIQQTIGQLEASINKVEPYLSVEDFKDYCDSTYTSISYWRVILRNTRQGDVEELINPLVKD